MISYRLSDGQHLEPSVIFGRAIKNEYLTLATLFTAGAATYVATSGKKQVSAGSSGQTLAEKVNEAVPINAGSRCASFVIYTTHITQS